MLGEKTFDIIKSLEEREDKLTVEGFLTVPEMITNISNRGKAIERVIVSSKVLESGRLLEDLGEYLKTEQPRALMLVVCNAETDVELAQQVNDMFLNPLFTDVTIKQMNIPLLQNVCTDTVDALRVKYSIVKEEEIETLDDVVVSPKVEVVKEDIRPMRRLPQEKQQYARVYEKSKKPSKLEIEKGDYTFEVFSHFAESLS